MQINGRRCGRCRGIAALARTISTPTMAKRVPWFLRAEGAGDVPAPSGCMACFQQAKGWLSELVADAAEFRVDLAGQVAHTSNGP
jgi:hypothetical protein